MVKLGALSIVLVAATLLGSCRKESQTSAGVATTTEGAKNLERRIQDFYGRMKSIRDGQNSYKNAKVTDDVYISVDSAEFLIESTYNYYVAGTDDDSSEVRYFAFSFPITITNDSILSESEASAILYQIKDSIVAEYDLISYTNKTLALFDLEIDYSPGTGQGNVDVSYSITFNPFPKPTVSSIPGNPDDAWITTQYPCSTNSSRYFSGFPLRYRNMSQGLQLRNGYYNGTCRIDYSGHAVATGSQSCSNPGAAVLLRSYGINNYKASYGYTTPGLLYVNITGGTPFVTKSLGISFDYKTRGFTQFQDFKQFFTEETLDAGGDPSQTGQNFYTHWLNTDMMNFYLGHIPSLINTAHSGVATSGTVFYDFQISLLQTRNSSNSPVDWDISHRYFNYFAFPTQLPLPSTRIPVISL